MVRLEQQDDGQSSCRHNAQCARLRSWVLERERRRLLVAALCNSFLKKTLFRPVSPLSSDEEDGSDDSEENEEEEEEEEEEQAAEAQVESLDWPEYDPASDTVEEYVPACRIQSLWRLQDSACYEDHGGQIWQETAPNLREDSVEEYALEDRHRSGKRDCDSAWECAVEYVPVQRECTEEYVSEQRGRTEKCVSEQMGCREEYVSEQWECTQEYVPEQWECTEEYVPEDCGSRRSWGHMANECQGGGCDCIVVRLTSDDGDSEDGEEVGETLSWWESACQKGWAHLESECPGDGCDYVVVMLPSDDDDGSEEEPE
ncbi:gametocyte surface protein P230-like [Schistocerca gregaria]|uniref:gametocyte surface protein P230-like n=1 Tax=Schistocerca gregaria TaxID=7010 RepID=UPI00211DC2F4|nr:gametocyte surface protein P230-like [Schistocerca gregaria]